MGATNLATVNIVIPGTFYVIPGTIYVIPDSLYVIPDSLYVIPDLIRDDIIVGHRAATTLSGKCAHVKRRVEACPAAVIHYVALAKREFRWGQAPPYVLMCWRRTAGERCSRPYEFSHPLSS